MNATNLQHLLLGYHFYIKFYCFYVVQMLYTMIVVGYIPATFTAVLIPQLLPLLDVWNLILKNKWKKSISKCARLWTSPNSCYLGQSKGPAVILLDRHSCFPKDRSKIGTWSFSRTHLVEKKWCKVRPQEELMKDTTCKPSARILC